MKTNKFFQLLTLAICAVMFAFVTGCEGPQGETGPAGADGTNGTNGTNGTDGTDGVDGKVSCLECHSDTTPLDKGIEFHRSVHAAGAIAVDYAGGRASCAACHSHEGYIEFAATGTVAEDIAVPTAWQCSTCHNIHTTFEKTDYAFRLGDPVTFIAGGQTIDAANNNTCINCHQARREYSSYLGTEDKTYNRVFSGADIAVYTNAAVGPAGSTTLEPQGTNGSLADSLRVVFDVPFETYDYISSTHAGPHHGPQGNVWDGLIGTVDGVMYEAHSDGCVKCHMGAASGHSFKPKTENCISEGCHGNTKQPALDAFAKRLLAVGMALDAIHAVHFDAKWDIEDDGVVGAFHPMYASLKKDDFKAWWNFTVLLEDRSNSAHNPTYMEALLKSCEVTLNL